MLQVIGLTLAGGILLLWVAWKMWRELREQAKAAKNGDDGDTGRPAPKTQRAAVMQIVVADLRSEEHTSELQSLMRISYAVFCLKKKTKTNNIKQQETYNQSNNPH